MLSRTPDTGEMELIGNVLALAMLQAHAAMWLGRRLARMSFAAWLRVLRRAAESVRAGGGSPSRDSPGGRFRGFRRMLRNAVRDDYVRRRSKQSLDYPRKKRGSPPGPPQLLSLPAKQRELFSCLKLLGVIKDG